MRLYDKRIGRLLDEINANPELKRQFISKLSPSSSTIELSGELDEILGYIAKDLKCTKSEVIRIALSAFRFLHVENKKGFKLILEHKYTNERKKITDWGKI